MDLIYFPIIVSVFALAFVWFLVSQIKKIKIDGEKRPAISEGLKKQYKIIGIVGLVIVILLLIWPGFGWKVAVGFLVGAVLSGLTGFLGMIFSAQANKRIAASALRQAPGEPKGLAKVLDVSFKGGLVAGLIIISLGLLAVSGYYRLTGTDGLIGLLSGASLVSVFSRIYRENFTVVAATSADTFETFVIAIIATMILGVFLFPRDVNFVLLPLLLASVSILTSIVGSFFVRLGKKQNIMGAMYKGIIATVILSAIAFYPVILKLMPNQAISVMNLWASTVVGLIFGVGALLSARNLKFEKYITALLIAAAVFVSFWLAGVYGFALAVLAMLSVSGIIAGVGVFGQIAQDVKTSEASEEVKKITEALGAASISAKAVESSYAIASAGLGSLVLFFLFSEQVLARGAEILQFVLTNPNIIPGILIGGLLPYLLVSSLAESEGKKIFLPALISIASPILIGLILGTEALAGMLIGAIIVGLFVATSMTTEESSENNKFVAGPAINSLIKCLCVVSLLIISFLV